MKLDSVQVFVVGNPPPAFGGRYFVFLKLKTACGIEGVGEVYAATFGPHVTASPAAIRFRSSRSGAKAMVRVSACGRICRSWAS